MKFDELAGNTTVDAQQAIAHITGWFEAEDRVCVVGMRNIRGAGKNVISQACTAKELVEQLRGDSGTALLEGLIRDTYGDKWNVYISAAAVGEDTTVTRRGGLDNVVSMPGVYADLDVKHGAFDSEAAILTWLRAWPEPSLLTATGSGGVHAWWRTTVPLNLTDARELQRRWWTLIAEKAAPREVDHLIDPSRVMRLAGSVRWPKPGEELTAAPVRVLHRNLSARYEPEYIRELTENSTRRRDEAVKATRAHDAQQRVASDALAELANAGNEWAARAALANVENRFNELVTWDDVLVPNGWQVLREDRDGRREWSRPGSRSKSATTDWPVSPDIMSLFSWSPDTQLHDLFEASIVLTKFRVAQRLIFNDSYDAIVKWTLSR